MLPPDPGLRLLLHLGMGLRTSGRRKQEEALAEQQRGRGAAGPMEGSSARRATAGPASGRPPRLGSGRSARPGPSLAALDSDLASSGEVGNARAEICLADGNRKPMLSPRWTMSCTGKASRHRLHDGR